MLQSKIGRNFLLCFLLLNGLLVAAFIYGAWQRPDFLSVFLPGKFGPAIAPDMTGNILMLAVILLVNALLFVTFGIGGTWHAMWAGLRVSPKRLRWLLHERVGLASDISGVVAAAIQEEEKAEIHYLDQARGLLATGIVLFAVAVPALCMAYVAAAPQGAPIFESAGHTIPNSAVTADETVRFAADQLAALALDIPSIFHLRATPIEINGANLLLGVLVVLYRTLIGLGLILLFVGMRRARALLFNALEVAMPVADIVAMEPMLQDGHGHTAPEHVEHVVHHHVHEEAPAPPEHHGEHHGEHHDHHVDHSHDAHDRGHAEPETAETSEELADGDVVEIEDANHVVHHAVIHDHPAAHVHVAPAQHPHAAGKDEAA